MNAKKASFLLIGLSVLVFVSGCAHSTNDNPPMKHAVTAQSSLMLVYLRPTQLYYPKNEAAIIKPYKAEIAKLHIKSAMLDSLHSVANNTPWISAIKVGHYLKNGKGGMDLHEYWLVSHSGDYDGVVSVRSTIELTPGLKNVLLAVSVWVQKNVSSVPIMLDSKDITETVSIENAGAPLSLEQIKTINSNDTKMATNERAKIWFAEGGHRLENAVLFDLSVMTRNLHKFLSRRH